MSLQRTVFTLFITLTALVALPSWAEEDETDKAGKAIAATESCVADPQKTIQEKRACVDACFEAVMDNSSMKLCQGLSVAAETGELQRVLAGSKKRLEEELQSSEDYVRDDARAKLDRLDASQKAFESSLQPFCDFEAIVMLGGTGESLEYMGCVTVLTRERADSIKKIIL